MIDFIGFSFSVDKLTCGKEVGPAELPATILSQYKLHIQPYPVTQAAIKNLKTVETRERFQDDPEDYSKYRHTMRQEFETHIMVINNISSYVYFQFI